MEAGGPIPRGVSLASARRADRLDHRLSGGSMRAQKWLILGMFLLPMGSTDAQAQGAVRKPFTVVEASIPEMRAALARRAVTSRELVLQYLARIATYED